MNWIKKSYYYLFYKLYRFFESLAYPWWSDTKATFVIDFLTFLILLSICVYYKIFIDKYLTILALKYWFVALLIFVGLINSWLFSKKDKYKLIVEKFDKLPKKQNRIGSWLVSLFICLVCANFIYSFYLFSQIDWSQYR